MSYLLMRSIVRDYMQRLLSILSEDYIVSLVLGENAESVSFRKGSLFDIQLCYFHHFLHCRNVFGYDL